MLTGVQAFSEPVDLEGRHRKTMALEAALEAAALDSAKGSSPINRWREKLIKCEKCRFVQA